jgi:drug/metabolite transporter (DMT)-like permease
MLLYLKYFSLVAAPVRLSMHHKHKLSGYLAILGASILWGTSFPVIKMSFTELDLSPLTFLTMRFLLTLTVLAPLLVKRTSRRDITEYLKKPDIMILGAVNGAAFSFQFLGQARVPAIVASLLINSYLLFTPFFARTLLGSTITPRKKVAVTVGFLGTAVIALGNFAGNEDIIASLVGVPMVLVSGVLYSLYIVYSEKNMSSTGQPVLIFFSSTVYSLATILISGLILRDLPGMRPFPIAALWPVAYLSLLCTALAFILYLHAIQQLGSVDSAVYLLLNIVAGILLSFFMLGEIPDIFNYIGASLIFFSIYLIKKPRQVRVVIRKQ